MPNLGIECLNARDLLILQLLGDNVNTKQIAARLGLSPRTIEYHIDSKENPHSVAAKIGLSGQGRTALVRFACEHQLTTPVAKPKPKLDPVTIDGMDSMAKSICQIATQAANRQADPVQCACLCHSVEAFIKLERLRFTLNAAGAQPSA